MKALSLYQPWASLLALGIKKFETRCWSTNYRGPLAIHAAWNIPKEAHAFYKEVIKLRLLDPNMDLPRGCIVATCNLHDVQSTDAGGSVIGLQAFLGDFSAGRFIWFLSDIKPVNPVISVKGRQRLFNVEIPA